jgi:hypothetical protein
MLPGDSLEEIWHRSSKLRIKREEKRWLFLVIYYSTVLRSWPAFTPNEALRRLGQARASYGGQGTRK